MMTEEQIRRRLAGRVNIVAKLSDRIDTVRAEGGDVSKLIGFYEQGVALMQELQTILGDLK